MSRVKKKASGKKKFDTDVVSNNVVDKYGDVVSTGTEVLETINSLQTIGVSPALDIALGGGLREGSVVVIITDGDIQNWQTTLTLLTELCNLDNDVFLFLMDNKNAVGKIKFQCPSRVCNN